MVTKTNNTENGMTATTTTHWLRFNLHEDEAQMTGTAFEPSTDGKTVVVFDTYGNADYQEMWGDRKVMSVEDARALWTDLLTKDNDDGYGNPVFEHRA